MAVQYMVKAFVSKVAGCDANDGGWSEERRKQFQDLLNQYATNGWHCHSSEYRQIRAKGCRAGKGTWLIFKLKKES